MTRRRQLVALLGVLGALVLLAPPAGADPGDRRITRIHDLDRTDFVVESIRPDLSGINRLDVDVTGPRVQETWVVTDAGVTDTALAQAGAQLRSRVQEAFFDLREELIEIADIRYQIDVQVQICVSNGGQQECSEPATLRFDVGPGQNPGDTFDQQWEALDLPGQFDEFNALIGATGGSTGGGTPGSGPGAHAGGCPSYHDLFP